MTNPKRLWSPSRPIKPPVDPLYLEIVKLLAKDKRTKFEKANDSGLSTSTFANWESKKVKNPQGTSLQMAAEMLGYQVRLIPKK